MPAPRTVYNLCFYRHWYTERTKHCGQLFCATQNTTYICSFFPVLLYIYMNQNCALGCNCCAGLYICIAAQTTPKSFQASAVICNSLTSITSATWARYHDGVFRHRSSGSCQTGGWYIFTLRAIPWTTKTNASNRTFPPSCIYTTTHKLCPESSWSANRSLGNPTSMRGFWKRAQLHPSPIG